MRAILWISALRRMRANCWLDAAAFGALLLAVALSLAIPLYAEAASLRLLNQTIQLQEARSGRSAFALLERYLAAWNTPLEWERIPAADAALQRGVEQLDLPIKSLVRHARSPNMQARLLPNHSPLPDLAPAFLSGMQDQIELYDGRWPAAHASPLEGLVSRSLADQLGLNLGDQLVLTNNRSQSIQVALVGIWRARDPLNAAWFYPPSAFDQLVLLDEAQFSGSYAQQLNNEIDQMLWFVQLDGAGLNAANSARLESRLAQLQHEIQVVLSGARLEQSPLAALANYRQQADQLSRQLFLFSTPIFGLILLFLMLIMHLLLERQIGEIALLKTRGIADRALIAISLIEWGILALAGLLFGCLLGFYFAALLARSTSFLQIDSNIAPAQIRLTWRTLLYACAALLIALSALGMPLLRALRLTLRELQQGLARRQTTPFWQRAYLDLCALAGSAYLLWELARLQKANTTAEGTQILSDNLLVLAIPILFCLAWSLLLVRFLPMLFALLQRWASRRTWLVPLLVLRNLARQPEHYRGALLLLILTLSFVVYSSAIASSIDKALQANISYSLGADSQLIETGLSTERDAEGNHERRDIREAARFQFVPLDEHLRVEGIRAAARVGAYRASLRMGVGSQQAQLIGVDRLHFPQVMPNFDPAWANGRSLGELMNLLARNPYGVLVDQRLIERGLRIGDTLSIQAELFGDHHNIDLIVVAGIELWPGFYPQEGLLLVTNLVTIFDQAGGQYPYNVWISRDPNSDLAGLLADLRALDIEVIELRDRAEILRSEYLQPQRQGVFGLLSLGFLSASVCTISGFLLAAISNARSRAIELGLVRAMGLNDQSAVLAILAEYGLILAIACLYAALLGIAAAASVLPLFQSGIGAYPNTPPMALEIPWFTSLAALASVSFVIVLALFILSALQVRLGLFAAIKLGDSL